MQALLDEIALAVKRIYRDAVDPLEAPYAFEARPAEGELAGAPMVLFLGNHSSGKSTFINHLLGLAVQKTGLAPTDDAFTVVQFGGADEERDGPAAVSNPQLPFGGLRDFGPTFLSHFRVKLRPVPLLRELVLVDSPGMIDAARADAGRGYDFTGVARWFAERADVVLVFFDPEKPGTTGETLQVFTEALRGLDHKILIVLNKVDRFSSLPDFARAYGALCWNLGKVMPRKDLPHLYTTFVPVEGAPKPDLPMKEFEAAREELVREIRRAPARRVDNLITRLEDHARRLWVHARTVSEAKRELSRFRWKSWGMVALLVGIGALAGGAALQLGAGGGALTSIWGGTALLALAAQALVGGLVRSHGEKIVAGLDAVFERAFARELLMTERGDDLRSLWSKVRPRARLALTKARLPRLPGSARRRLEQAIEKEIPELRARLHRELGSAR
jgi:energy-coupling factor transporter ATP-binding protein EcfA2